MSTTVVHCKKEKFDVYIGRPGKWGNPFEIGSETREQVIEKYECWLLEHPELIEDAKKELKNKILGCWCNPLPCHGDVLARIVNEVINEPQDRFSNWCTGCHGCSECKIL